MQTIEERLDQLERRNRRLTAALAVLAVAICAVVTVAATGLGEVTKFDTVAARHIIVTNDADQPIITLSSDADGAGLVTTYSAKGHYLVVLTSNVLNDGVVTTYQPITSR